jgi:hypothetical protein
MWRFRTNWKTRVKISIYAPDFLETINISIYAPDFLETINISIYSPDFLETINMCKVFVVIFNCVLIRECDRNKIVLIRWICIYNNK